MFSVQLTISFLFFFISCEFSDAPKNHDQNGNADGKSGFGGKPKFDRNSGGDFKKFGDKGNNKFGDRNNKSFGGEKKAREGDWTCAGCNNSNFAWRTECKRCNAGKDGAEGAPAGRNSFGGERKQFETREGDWTCPSCNNSNFAWRTECKRCNAGKDGAEGAPASGNSRGGFRGGRGGRGNSRGGNSRGNSRGAPRGGRGGFNKSFGGFEGKNESPSNKKIKFDE